MAAGWKAAATEIVLKGGEMNLKTCPFCGKTDTLVIEDAADCEACETFGVAVICDIGKGGCGSAGGYGGSNKEAAIKAWNMRKEQK